MHWLLSILSVIFNIEYMYIFVFDIINYPHFDNIRLKTLKSDQVSTDLARPVQS